MPLYLIWRCPHDKYDICATCGEIARAGGEIPVMLTEYALYLIRNPLSPDQEPVDISQSPPPGH